MLIPKIEYVGAIASVLVVPNTHLITLKDSSTVSSGTISSKVWSIVTISGAPNLIYSETDGDEFVFGVATTAAYRVRIVLTVTDSSGRQSISSALLINDGVGNINIAFLTLETNVLADGFIVFEPQESLTTVLGTALSISNPLWTSYQLDYTNNGTYDDTNSTRENFEHSYTSTSTNTAQLSITHAPSAILINQLYTQVTFEPIILNPRDVVVSSSNSCTIINVSSETSDMVEKLVGRANVDNSSMEYLEVKLDVNCCTVVNSLKLAPTYDLGLSIDTLSYQATVTTMNVSGNSYRIYTVELSLTGISSSIISSIAYTAGANSNTTVTTITNTPTPIPVSNQMTIQFLMENPPLSGFPVIVENKTITITTVEGYVYVLPFTATPNHLSGEITIVIGTITYPAYPTGVSVILNTGSTDIQFESTILGTTYTTFYDGVYTFTLNDSGISNTYISGCAFIDCETYCLIIGALANGCSPYIKIMYDALNNFANCNSIPCTGICEIYAYLETLLNECDCSMNFSSSITTNTKNCGC